MAQRGLSSDALGKVFPGVNKLFKENDMVGGYFDALSMVNSIVSVYSITQYGISVGNGRDAEVKPAGNARTYHESMEGFLMMYKMAYDRWKSGAENGK